MFNNFEDLINEEPRKIVKNIAENFFFKIYITKTH